MLRECSNINSYIKKHQIKTLYSGYKNDQSYDGDSIEFRNGCSYRLFLFKLLIMNDRVCLTLDTESIIVAEPNSDDYVNINGSWYVKFIKINNIDKNLFKDGSKGIQFVAVKRNQVSRQSISTLTFILMNDGWLTYSQSDNNGLSGEELAIDRILIPSIRIGFNSMIEQKKLSYNFIKNSLSYYNKLFIIQ